MDLLCPGCNVKSKSFHETSPCTLIHLTIPPRLIMIHIVLTSAKDGVGDGQVDFEALREDVAQSFLPWENSLTKFEKAVPWLNAAISTVAGFVPLVPIAKGLIPAVASAGSAFGGAALTELAGDPSIRPMLVEFIFVLVLLLIWVIMG